MRMGDGAPRPGVVIAAVITTATVMLHCLQPGTVVVPAAPAALPVWSPLPPEEDAQPSAGALGAVASDELGPVVQRSRKYPTSSSYGRIPRCRWDRYPRMLSPETNSTAAREVLVFMRFLEEVVYQRLGYLYVLRDGSLLGAVRQGGMIPGDADLDAMILLPQNETLADVYRVHC